MSYLLMLAKAGLIAMFIVAALFLYPFAIIHNAFMRMAKKITGENE